jgi:predicted nucleic acid-binding protein
LHKLDEGKIDIIGSIVLEDEINRIKGDDKRVAVSELIYWSISNKVVDIPVIYRQIAKLGLKTRDSAHIACAINGGAGYFITVDDDILKRKDKIESKYNIKVCNPVEFIKEVG